MLSLWLSWLNNIRNVKLEDFVFQHAFYCHVCHCSLCTISHQTLLFLCIYPFAVADLGEGSEEPFGLKKIAEGRKVGRASQKKKIRAPSLAKGVDPPLICMAEALLASAVSCRMISMQFS